MVSWLSFLASPALGFWHSHMVRSSFPGIWPRVRLVFPDILPGSLYLSFFPLLCLVFADHYQFKFSFLIQFLLKGNIHTGKYINLNEFSEFSPRKHTYVTTNQVKKMLATPLKTSNATFQPLFPLFSFKINI